MPFWRYGFLPPPETSPRVLVLCVPWRAAASWATTTWCISGTLAVTSKIVVGQLDAAVGRAGRGGDLDGGHQAPTLLWLLDGGLDQHDAALGAGDGAVDQHQALVGVDGVHGQVLGGHLVVAHPAGHPQALEHPAGGGAAADGTRRAVLALHAVAGAEAA